MKQKLKSTRALAVALIAFGSLAGEANALVILEYRFDGTANDSSGNGYNASLAGDATYAAGYSGSALSLDGSGDYAFFDGDLPDLTNFTVEFWLNVPTYSSNVHYFSLYDDNYVVVGDYSSGPVSTWADGLNPVDAGSSLNIPIPTANEWHHIAFTFDGSNQRIFIDGVLSGTVATTGSLTSNSGYNSGLNIGSRYNESTQFVSGLIDNVRLHDNALSVNELEPNAIPEPSAALLFGLGALGFVSRRKRAT